MKKLFKNALALALALMMLLSGGALGEGEYTLGSWVFAEDPASVTGTVRFYIPFKGNQGMDEMIAEFNQTYPNVTIELTEAASASLEGLLQKGQIDLALAALEANEANIAYELIEKESIGILAGKDSQLAQLVPSGTPISLEMVEKEAFVSLDTSHSSRISQDRLFRRYNIRPKILLETSSLEVARRVALKSGACMVLPDVYADEFVFNSGGAFYPLKDYENHRHFYACYRNDENTKKYIRDFVSITTSVLNQTTHGKRI